MRVAAAIVHFLRSLVRELSDENAYHRYLADGGRPLMLAWYRQQTGGPVTVVSATTLAGSVLPAPLLFLRARHVRPP